MKKIISHLKNKLSNYSYRQILIYRTIFSALIFSLIIFIYYTATATPKPVLFEEFNNGNDTIKNKKPDVQVKVNKQYDEQGNVIAYDSSYSYSWSGNMNDVNADSLFKLFGFQQQFFNESDFNFPDLSQLSPSGRLKDYRGDVMKQFEEADRMMDQIRRHFFGQNFSPFNSDPFQNFRKMPLSPFNPNNIDTTQMGVQM